MTKRSGTVSMERVGTANNIALFILDRPAKSNAYDDATIGQFAEQLATTVADPSIRAAVVTGRGERVFCAGADLSSLSDRSYEDGLSLQSRQLFDAWALIARVKPSSSLCPFFDTFKT